MSALLDTGFIRRVYTAAGCYVVDCRRDGVGGRDWIGLPVLIVGGGARGVIAPPDVGSEVAIAYAHDGRAFVLGTVQSQAVSMSKVASAEKPATQVADTSVDVDTVVTRNAGGAQAIDRRGAVTTRPAPGQPTRVELTDGGVLAVIRDGAAPDRAVLTDPLVQVLAERDARITALEARVAKITATNAAAAAGTPAGPVLAAEATQAAAAAASPLVSVSQTDIGSGVLRLSGDLAT